LTTDGNAYFSMQPVTVMLSDPTGSYNLVCLATREMAVTMEA